LLWIVIDVFPGRRTVGISSLLSIAIVRVNGAGWQLRFGLLGDANS